MKFWFLQPDYQHHKNRLLNIGMLAGNKNKTIVELDSNQHNSYLVAPPLFERQAVVRLFFCVFFSSICRQILCLFSRFLDFFFKWMAMRWRSRGFWFLVVLSHKGQLGPGLDNCARWPDRPQSWNSSSLLNRANCLRRSGSMKVQILQTSILQSNLVLKELLILILEILVLVQDV